MICFIILSTFVSILLLNCCENTCFIGCSVWFSGNSDVCIRFKSDNYTSDRDVCFIHSYPPPLRSLSVSSALPLSLSLPRFSLPLFPFTDLCGIIPVSYCISRFISGQFFSLQILLMTAIGSRTHISHSQMISINILCQNCVEHHPRASFWHELCISYAAKYSWAISCGRKLCEQLRQHERNSSQIILF